MKIIIACDYYVRPEMFSDYNTIEENGNEIIFYDNELIQTIDQFSETMLKTEQGGPESVDAGQGFVDACKDVDIIITHLTPVNKAVIDNAKNLKYVGIMRGGVDNVNVGYLKEKGIKSSNAPWRSSYAVADFAIGMMISECKNIAKSHAQLKAGIWNKDYPNSDNYTDMRNKTVGIIGYGWIGKLVEKELSGFGTKVIVYDPFLSEERIKENGGCPVTLDDLLEKSDIITIHLRLSEKTAGFMGAEQFSKMKKTATFINTARSGLVDTNALVDALKNKKIAGAAIDVFDIEPLTADNNPYIDLDNVTITPHIAGVSNDTIRNAIEIVLDDLKHFLNDEKIICLL